MAQSTKDNGKMTKRMARAICSTPTAISFKGNLSIKKPKDTAFTTTRME